MRSGICSLEKLPGDSETGGCRTTLGENTRPDRQLLFPSASEILRFSWFCYLFRVGMEKRRGLLKVSACVGWCDSCLQGASLHSFRSGNPRGFLNIARRVLCHDVLWRCLLTQPPAAVGAEAGLLTDFPFLILTGLRGLVLGSIPAG